MRIHALHTIYNAYECMSVSTDTDCDNYVELCRKHKDLATVETCKDTHSIFLDNPTANNYANSVGAMLLFQFHN